MEACYTETNKQDKVDTIKNLDIVFVTDTSGSLDDERAGIADGITNFDRIATWLARMNPDLIALCEMPPDQIPTLVNALNSKTGRTWNSHFVPKAPGINEGNLILSKYAFASVSSRYLSYTRSVAQATVNVGGRNINFFATHLDHTSSSLRQTEVGELMSFTSGFAAPRIVAGDMNAANDTPEVLS